MRRFITDRKKQVDVQDWIGLLAAIGLVVGFFWSRAVLSISMIVLFLNTFWPTNFKDITRRYFSNWFCKGTIIYFFIYLLSYLWSENRAEWQDAIILKLPALILPFAVWSIPLHKAKYKHAFLLTNVILISYIIIYSLSMSLNDWQSHVAQYSSSKLIPTYTKASHIRLGLYMSVLCLLLFQSIIQDHTRQLFKRIYIVAIIMMASYLHILSAKTGLISIYIVLLGMGFYFLSKRLSIAKASIISILGFIGVFWIAFYFVPTLNKKVNYVLIEAKMVSSGKHLDYNYSDLGRIITYQIGIEKIKEMPLLGYGPGDLMDKMDEGYNKLYPDVPKLHRYVPINQYLLELMVFGWLLVWVFIIMTAAPLFYQSREKKYFLVINTIIFFFALNVEAMLETQFGTFTYFFLTPIWFVLDREDNVTLPHK